MTSDEYADGAELDESSVMEDVAADVSLQVILPGYLPGVATPVLLKYLCSHRVSRTSVLEETHPRLFQSLQTILESVHGTCIHCVMIQTVPSVD